MIGKMLKWRVVEAYGFRRVGQIIELDEGAAKIWVQRGKLERVVEAAESVPQETACRRPARRRSK